MITNTHTRYFLFGIVLLAFAIKIHEKCRFCSVLLIVGFVAFEVMGFVTLKKYKERLKKHENYGQKKDE